MSPQLSLIARQNDAFRATLQMPTFGPQELKGSLLITPGISALAPITQIEVMAAVRSFDAFTADNDPYGEHDFGSIEQPGAGRIFWKIDYYDRSLEGGSPDPSDPALTHRVLTIMLTSEY